MNVGVQISQESEDLDENFNYRCFSIIAANNPEKHFYFLFDHEIPEKAKFLPNITPIFLPPAVKNRLAKYYWYNYKLPRALNRFNIAVFVSSGTQASPSTNCRQCAFARNKDESKSGKITIKDKRKAEIFSGLLISDHIHQEINFPGNIAVTIIPLPADTERMQNTAEKKEAFLEKFTGGTEYFLYLHSGNPEYAIRFLKAFSLFKKWQRSSMKAVMIDLQDKNGEISRQLQTYKWKDDVIILNTENLNEAAGSAYACYIPPSAPLVHSQILRSQAAGTPVITEINDIIRAYFQDSIFYCANDEKSISESLMHVYKNESDRLKMSRAGKEFSVSHDWKLVAAKVWETING